MTPEEFQDSVTNCTHFLPGDYPRSVKERMTEIADSAFAEFPRDVYGNGGFVQVFEQEIAELLGKESAVIMPSGTMAQQIALRIWADHAENKKVGFHPTCHLEMYEHMAYKELHQLESVLIGKPDRLFTLADLRAIEHPLSSVLVELPQREIGGQLPSWEELSAITAHVKSTGAKLHLDGARLWECQPFFQRPYKEIVAAFDSVYVSFYKILLGLPGAALAGPADFIAEARIWMRRHGGNLVHMFPTAISAKIGLDKRLPRISSYVNKAAEVAALLKEFDWVTVEPQQPLTNMMHLYFDAPVDEVMDAVGRIAQAEKCLLFSWAKQTDRGSKVELSIGEGALDLSSQRIRALMMEFHDLVGTHH